MLSSDWQPGYADRYAARLGQHDIDLVELPLFKPEELDWQNTRAALEKNDLRAHFSMVLPSFLDLVARNDEAADFMKMALGNADRAGGKVVTGVTYATVGGMTPAMPRQKDTDAVCRYYDKVAATAKSLGMTVGIEAVNRYETKLVNTARQARQIIERVGSDALMVHLDTYHMNIEEEGYRQGIAEAGDLLGYVHLSESNRGVPGLGTVDWQACFEGLRDIGFAGPLVLESFVCMVEEFAGGLCVWRPVAENPDDVIDRGVPFIREQAKKAGYL